MSKPKIGFIGLGAMGKPMARRLLEAGYEVASCANRNRAPIEELEQIGLVDAGTAKAVVESADIVMLVVWDEAQIDGILRGENAALRSMKAGSTVFLMSTISPDYCRALATEASKRDVTVLDCPLAGMPIGAENGTLSLMLGGEVEDIEAHRATKCETADAFQPFTARPFTANGRSAPGPSAPGRLSPGGHQVSQRDALKRHVRLTAFVQNADCLLVNHRQARITAACALVQQQAAAVSGYETVQRRFIRQLPKDG